MSDVNFVMYLLGKFWFFLSQVCQVYHTHVACVWYTWWKKKFFCYEN